MPPMHLCQPRVSLCVRYLRLKWLAGFQIHINAAIVHTLAFFRLVPRGTQVSSCESMRRRRNQTLHIDGKQ